MDAEQREFAKTALMCLTPHSDASRRTYTFAPPANIDIATSARVYDLIRAAHGDMMPDDYVFRFLHDVLDAIAHGDDIEDVQADVYTSDLVAWVASHPAREAYCTQVLRENEPGTFWQLVTLAQMLERMDIASRVLAYLEDSEG